jgi:hypothetical protein
MVYYDKLQRTKNSPSEFIISLMSENNQITQSNYIYLDDLILLGVQDLVDHLIIRIPVVMITLVVCIWK